MRISDKDYFRSCVAKERQLARLLGHIHIEEDYESAGTSPISFKLQPYS